MYCIYALNMFTYADLDRQFGRLVCLDFFFFSFCSSLLSLSLSLYPLFSPHILVCLIPFYHLSSAHYCHCIVHMCLLCPPHVQLLTKGCETSEMTLRRNGLGQLGFHVNYEGIVAEVSVCT